MSKNFQINYDVKVNDLSAVGTSAAIANLKKLAEAQKKIDKERILNKNAVIEKVALMKAAAQKKIDKERILNKNAVIEKVALMKAAKQEDFNQKKKNELYIARYKQLLSRKSYMDKVRNLKALKGDEDALRKYISNRERQLSSIRSKIFSDPSKQYENTLKELAVMNIRNRAETMLGHAINANNRAREKSITLQKQLAERRAGAEMAIGAASGAALYGGARGLGVAFGQAMTLEQLGIAMRAQFGVEGGNKAAEEMKTYARDTAFTLREATQLLLGVKIGAKNIGVKDVRQQIDFTKEIGKSILAYGGNVEDRFEIGHQLSQIFMAGSANNRQDLKVIAKRGLPIYQALESVTGKKFKEIQQFYGTEVPASLVAKAILAMSKGPEVARAMRERSLSFTQSYESGIEQAGYTAGKFGEVVAKAMKIPNMLRGFTSAMADLEDSLGREDVGGLANFALTVGGLTAGFMTLNGLVMAGYASMKYFAGTTLAANLGLGSMSALLTAIGTKLLVFSGISSAIYLGISDWSKMFDDINQKGLSGLLGHLDKLVSMLAVLGAGFAAGGLPGMAVAAAGLGAMTLYKSGKQALENNDEIAWAKLRAEVNPKSPVGGNMPPLMNPAPNSALTSNPTINLEQTINVDKSGNVKTTTKAAPKNPYDSPLIYESWGNNFNFSH